MMTLMKALERRRPRRVGDLLTAAVPGLAERMVEGRIRSEWARAVGGELARRSQPGELRAGVLEVLADNSPWLQELHMRTDELLGALRARYGPAVTALRFSLGRPPAAKPPAPRRRGEAPARLTEAESREIEALVAGLEDPDVAAALRRLLVKDRLARRQPHPTPQGQGEA